MSSMNSYQPIKLGGNANIDERDFCKLFQMSFFLIKEWEEFIYGKILFYK